MTDSRQMPLLAEDGASGGGAAGVTSNLIGGFNGGLNGSFKMGGGKWRYLAGAGLLVALALFAPLAYQMWQPSGDVTLIPSQWQGVMRLSTAPTGTDAWSTLIFSAANPAGRAAALGREAASGEPWDAMEMEASEGLFLAGAANVMPSPDDVFLATDDVSPPADNEGSTGETQSAPPNVKNNERPTNEKSNTGDIGSVTALEATAVTSETADEGDGLRGEEGEAENRGNKTGASTADMLRGSPRADAPPAGTADGKEQRGDSGGGRETVKPWGKRKGFDAALPRATVKLLRRVAKAGLPVPRDPWLNVRGYYVLLKSTRKPSPFPVPPHPLCLPRAGSAYMHAATPGYRVEPWVRRSLNLRAVPSKPVFWGTLSIVEAIKRLLATALLDPHNVRFVVLSERDVPLHSFPTVYRYLLASNQSYVGGYRKFFRDNKAAIKVFPRSLVIDGWMHGECWVEMARPHAMEVVRDWEWHEKGRDYCQVMQRPTCCVDENLIHNIITSQHPHQVANRSVMSVDWQRKTGHPHTYLPRDISPESMRSIQEEWHENQKRPYSQPMFLLPKESQQFIMSNRRCTVSGENSTCWLFARKFIGLSLRALMDLPRDVLGY
ncbi:unnamed protein product [Closterium sp. Naga37s-1]|nr:unnamed protein product [Closterium sp. Naga37s-1]